MTADYIRDAIARIRGYAPDDECFLEHFKAVEASIGDGPSPLEILADDDIVAKLNKLWFDAVWEEANRDRWTYDDYYGSWDDYTDTSLFEHETPRQLLETEALPEPGGSAPGQRPDVDAEYDRFVARYGSLFRWHIYGRTVRRRRRE